MVARSALAPHRPRRYCRHQARAWLQRVKQGWAVWTRRLCDGLTAIVKAYFQNCFVAMRAPSTMAANFAHTTSGSTAAWPTQVP